MNGLTLPEWIKTARTVLKVWRQINPRPSGVVADWVDGYFDCLLALEKDMKNGLLQGVVK